MASLRFGIVNRPLASYSLKKIKLKKKNQPSVLQYQKCLKWEVAYAGHNSAVHPLYFLVNAHCLLISFTCAVNSLTATSVLESWVPLSLLPSSPEKQSFLEGKTLVFSSLWWCTGLVCPPDSPLSSAVSQTWWLCWDFCSSSCRKRM